MGTLDITSQYNCKSAGGGDVGVCPVMFCAFLLFKLYRPQFFNNFCIHPVDLCNFSIFIIAAKEKVFPIR